MTISDRFRLSRCNRNRLPVFLATDFLLLSLYYVGLTVVLRGPLRFEDVPLILLTVVLVVPVIGSIMLMLVMIWSRLETGFLRVAALIFAVIFPAVAVAVQLAVRCFVLFQCA